MRKILLILFISPIFVLGQSNQSMDSTSLAGYMVNSDSFPQIKNFTHDINPQVINAILSLNKRAPSQGQWRNNGSNIYFNTGSVGIGNTGPVASALLELTSTTQGFIAPKMNTTQQNAISSPAAGLLIFNTDSALFRFYNGSAWTSISTGSGGGGGGGVTTIGTINSQTKSADGAVISGASLVMQNADASNTGLATVNQITTSIGATFNGFGTVVANSTNVYVTIPYNCTITNWYVTADASGSIVVDVKRSGSSIVGGGNAPTLSSQQSANAAVSGWTSVAITAGDILQFVTSGSATVTYVSVVLKVIK